MEKRDITRIMSKIKAFRQSFLVTDNIFNEWSKILESYRYEDVDKKLDEYFNSGSNFGQYPDAYYLIKYLKTEEELSKTQEIVVKCSLCGKEILYNDLQEHYDRCSSFDYVYRESKKYLHKTFDKNKLWEMDKEVFEKLYWKVCEELSKIMSNCLQKHCLENAIRTHQGLDPKYTLEEI